MMSFRSKPVGWRGESYRHHLASIGISNKYYSGKIFRIRNPATIKDLQVKDLQEWDKDGLVKFKKYDKNLYVVDLVGGVDKEFEDAFNRIKVDGKIIRIRDQDLKDYKFLEKEGVIALKKYGGSYDKNAYVIEMASGADKDLKDSFDRGEQEDVVEKEEVDRMIADLKKESYEDMLRKVQSDGREE